jgi:hypothetical protein
MPDYRQSLPRFSLSRLLASTALIAVGVAWLAHTINDYPAHDIKVAERWTVSIAIICAGISNLFGRPWTGLLLGGLFAIGLWMFLAKAFAPFLGI